jgi:hypothetical protein
MGDLLAQHHGASLAHGYSRASSMTRRSALEVMQMPNALSGVEATEKVIGRAHGPSFEIVSNELQLPHVPAQTVTAASSCCRSRQSGIKQEVSQQALSHYLNLSDLDQPLPCWRRV